MVYKDYEKHKARVRYNNRKYREEALKKISEDVKCVYCGCDEFSILEINHKELVGPGKRGSLTRSSLGLCFAILKGIIPIDSVEITCKICNIQHYVVKKFGITNHKIIWNKGV